MVWAVAPGAGDGLAEVAPFADFILVAVPVVRVAGDYFVNQRLGNSAEPLQHWRAGRDAFGAIPVDHQLLRPPRGWGRGHPPLASLGILLRADCRRHRAV